MHRDFCDLLTFLEAVVQAAESKTEHSHRCTCGVIWSHLGSNAGNEAAHICPGCGSGPIWERYAAN
jgi:hypothetical protein